MSRAFTAEQLDMLFDAIQTLEYGALGAYHQWRHITTALLAAEDTTMRPVMSRFAIDMAQHMLQETPLDPRPLSLLADAGNAAGAASSLPLKEWAARCAKPSGPFSAPATTDMEHEVSLRDIATDSPHVLHHLQTAFARALECGRYEQAARCIHHLPDTLPGRTVLADRLNAEVAMHSLPPQEALHVVNNVQHEGFAVWRMLTSAALLRDMGETERAAAQYTSAWNATSFHPNLTLVLYDLLHPHPALPIPETVEAPAIVLYSWNKAQELQQTLHSLRASSLGGTSITVLDNGSTDDTATMLRTMRETWADRPFTLETLPVNIGAPAARNWLLSMPQVKERPWTVFLDDDVILSADWLQQLWSTAQTHPGAGSVGGNVTDHTAPHAVQGADFFLLPEARGQRSFVDLQEHVFVYCNPVGYAESPLMRFTRPCLQVSGCCHMISRASVEACGGFDIRFTPSQFDDLERDMRACLAGFHSVYNGNLRIRHMQHSSMKQANTPAKNGHIFGNKIKLEHIHSAKDTETMRDTARAMVRADLKRKTARLHAMLGA